MNAVQFRREVMASLEGARGTYIHAACARDLEEKTSEGDPCGYRPWLAGLVEYLRRAYGLGANPPRILDLGCGQGEMTVMLRLMGYDAVGLDVNARTLGLARVLAAENGLAAGAFVRYCGNRLPFADGAFDIVAMISSLEHMDDAALGRLVPELARVCRGVVFVQVPSAMKVSDDHTGLKFVPWMPARMARAYVALRGPLYRYAISESGRWDVVYRDLAQIERCFATHFAMQPVPAEHSYPRCGPASAQLDLSKRVALGPLAFTLRVPLPLRRLRRAAGTRIEHFYPYYNVAFRKTCA